MDTLIVLQIHLDLNGCGVADGCNKAKIRIATFSIALIEWTKWDCYYQLKAFGMRPV